MKSKGEKIAMITAYDFSFARIFDSAEIDVILVGDSASNVMAGNETTLPITLDQMIYHAAGNDHKDLDSTDNFPNPDLQVTKTKASNWITVGASSDPSAEADFKSYTASFSNYGKNGVDVFAPGTRIYSTVPGGNNYRNLQGTSMASPVVAGLAALVLSYNPQLTAQQLKWVIEKSATPLTAKVKLPGTEDKMVQLSDISITGGVVNAYEALKLAATLKPAEKSKLPKSTIKKNTKG